MKPDLPISEAMARRLVLDELFDLTLYMELAKTTQGATRKTLEELIPIERRHHAFWQELLGVKEERLDLRRRLKLRLLTGGCRLLGDNAVHMTLETIEIYGVRKYLSIWESTKDTPFGQAVKNILNDEFKHEDAIVSGLAARKINPERIRSIFLGLNDGVVEMLGAVSGFFAAFSDPGTILMASSTVAVAGALSMAAGGYSASSSEAEMKRLEAGKAKFLDAPGAADPAAASPLVSALLVGSSYFVGALIPVLPVLLGAKSVLASILVAGSMMGLLSMILAFLSGMDIKKRIATNLLLLGAAVTVTYAIGLLTKRLWGISA